MNKQVLASQIIAHLTTELQLLTTAALTTHAEATDEESKAEGKYDTRSLEASYLAHGQSKAATEAALALTQFRALIIRDFTASDPVELGALVTLEGRGGSTYYFIGPRAGGTEIQIDGNTVLVITPHSPLGRQLLGRRQGDTLQLDFGGQRSEFRVANVA